MIVENETYTPLEIWTDGSCLGNPGGCGGWGTIIAIKGGIIRTLSGGELSTTNNRMELIAIIKGFQSLPITKEVVVYTDSQYIVNIATNKAIKSKNLDLWLEMDSYTQVIDNVKFVWVRGHSVNKLNNLADFLATTAAKGIQEWTHSRRPRRKLLEISGLKSSKDTELKSLVTE